jgi:transposase
MGRYDLTEKEWQAIQSHLPNKPRGVPRVDDRRVLNGIFWVLRSERYGPPTTIYNRFNRWRKAGVWDRLMDEITKLYDGDVQMIDTSIVRVHQHGATAKRGVRMEDMIAVLAAPEAASPPRSMPSSTSRADQSSFNSRPGRKATSKARKA